MDTLALACADNAENDDLRDERRHPLVQTTLAPRPESALDAAVGSVLGDEIVAGGFLVVPSMMPAFRQTGAPVALTSTREFGTSTKSCPVQVTTYVFPGEVSEAETHAPMMCPECGCLLEGNGTTAIRLQHLPMGMRYTRLSVSRRRVRCPKCGRGRTLDAPSEAERHHVTVPLLNFTCDLLSLGHTNKDVALMTGLDQHTAREIDKARLQRLHTEVRDGRRQLRRPERQSRYIGIDEFSLHGGHRYATVIMDLETGHVLWLAHGRKKAVVYEFCEFVGEEWLSGVVAVACDMNSDYEEAFRERNPRIAIVFDHFHIVKNFNEKVITEIRKDEQGRLRDEGDEEAAKALKGSKYILMTTRKRRERIDAEAAEGKVLCRGSELFNKPEVRRTHSATERYEEPVGQNKLLATCDIVKEMLDKAYQRKSAGWMRRDMNDIVDVCRGTGNKHFEWFARLIENHIDGIVAHGKHRISTGKVEGTNQMIKTLRRRGYGYPDDEYFFLKIFDASRRMSGDRELAS